MPERIQHATGGSSTLETALSTHPIEARATTITAGSSPINAGSTRTSPAKSRELDAPSHSAFLAQRRFAALNGLRCLAILEVIWRHSSERGGGRAWAVGIGVDLSFAISGFLITTLLVREFRRTGRIDVRRFYLRRTLRIFPLYFVVLGTYVLLVLGTLRGTPEGTAFMHHLAAYSTYTQNWFVPLDPTRDTVFFFSWSLATQEQFYLVWPLVLTLCLAPGRWWRAGAFALALIVLEQIALHVIVVYDFPLRVVRSIATPICLGALWSLVLHSPAGFAVARRLLGPRVVALALLAGVAASYIIAVPFGITESLIGALVAACCIREDTFAAPLLTAQPCRFVGMISYGMYLLHMFAINAVRHVIGWRFGPLVFLPAVTVTIAMSYASYRWFEMPILRYRDRVHRSRIEAMAPATVAGRAG